MHFPSSTLRANATGSDAKEIATFGLRPRHRRRFGLSFADGLLRVDESKGVLVRDIAFEKTRGDAIRIDNSEDVVFDSVSIRYSGNRALVIEGGARCDIRNSLIEHAGKGGSCYRAETARR